MEIKGKITIIDATESGTSNTTGRPWVSKNAVVEVEDGDRTPEHLALRFTGEEDVQKLLGCKVGDTIRCICRFYTSANPWTNREGKTVMIRRNECTCFGLEIVEMEGF